MREAPPSRRDGSRLCAIEFWIFDLDGTLTEPVHDFDAIRNELGLRPGRPILEQIGEMDDRSSVPFLERLDRIEREIARRARAQSGAHDLLSTLCERQKTLGILTRNSYDNALETLATCGLDRFFDPAHIIGRGGCAPKPSPEGILKLVGAWKTSADRTVMVGDYRFDVLAGRQAGTMTVSLDPDQTHEWSADADVTVRNLPELHRLVGGGQHGEKGHEHP